MFGLKGFRNGVVSLIALFSVTAPAQAATTIFSAGVFSESGVTDASNAIGPLNTAGALIGNAGSLVLSFAAPLTGAGLELTMLSASPPGGMNILFVSVGEVIAGSPVFSSNVGLIDNGTGGVLTADLTAQCAGVSATGCSLVRIDNIASLGGSTGALVDAVSGVTNAPEPSVWALMILSFGIVGWRIKQLRGRSLAPRRSPDARAALAAA